MEQAPYDRLHPESGWINGRLTCCRFCGGPIVGKRRTFCSGWRSYFRRIGGKFRVIKQGYGCVHEWMLRTNPGYARKHVRARDQGVCCLCGGLGLWQMDHIVPVIEGGADLGLENLRTLCLACHKFESARLAARRKFRARAWKYLTKDGNI